MRFRTTTLLLGALLLGACSDSTGGGGTPDGLTPGTFEASVTGDFTAEARGQAIFTGSATTVRLMDGRNPGQPTQLILQTGDIPQPGTYPVGPSVGVGRYFGRFYVAEGASLFAQTGEGTVTISEVSQQRVRGSFDVTLRTPGTGAARTVRAVGQFSAVPAA